jgi:rare lipoprotein A
MTRSFTCTENLSRRLCFVLLTVSLLLSIPSFAQAGGGARRKASKSFNGRVIYGLASFYNDRFNGRMTASGEIFRQSKLTCACNMLPFGTMVKITNTVSGKTVIVKVNDRLHTRMRRVADLSKAAAKRLGYTKSGIIRVKVEVLQRGRK